jgi:hypothetical protein
MLDSLLNYQNPFYRGFVMRKLIETSLLIVACAFFVHAQVPSITSFTPTSGPIGTTVTIIGTNFNPTLTNNIVYFGAVRAAVTGATSTSLTVITPTGATYQPITVTNVTTGLTAYSSKPFVVTFPSSQIIDATSFAAKVDFTTGYYPYSAAIGDLDGDGKPDIVSANFGLGTVSVLRNTSTSGAITSTSFATMVDFMAGSGSWSVAIGDIDGDGKPDIVVTNSISNTVSVLRNTSTSGAITSSSFATKVDFTTGSSPVSVAIGDIDGDGRLDIVVANEKSRTMSILRNTSTSGAITSSSFAAKVDFTTASSPISVAIGDIDGDGKPDIVVADANSDTVLVYRNTSASGAITSNSFAAKVDFTTGSSPYSVAIGDIDGDGKPDIAVANAYSNTVSILRNIITTNAAPAIPQNITAIAGNAQVTLRWNKNTESDFAQYRIYRSISPNPTIKVDSTTGGITDTTKIITGLTNGTTYYFRVTAVDSSGLESGYSNEVNATPALSVLQEIVHVSGGTFQMGSNDPNDFEASPPHSVTLGSYYIDKYEITYEKWTEVRNWALTHGYASADIAMGVNGYSPVGTNNPAGGMNWYDILKWCNAREAV